MIPKQAQMSHSLNSLKGLYGKYIGEYHRGYYGADYSSDVLSLAQEVDSVAGEAFLSRPFGFVGPRWFVNAGYARQRALMNPPICSLLV